MAAGRQCTAANCGLAKYRHRGDVCECECPISDDCDTVANHHARKTATVSKRPLPDARHGIGYRHTRKTATANECTISNVTPFSIVTLVKSLQSRNA